MLALLHFFKLFSYLYQFVFFNALICILSSTILISLKVSLLLYTLLPLFLVVDFVKTFNNVSHVFQAIHSPESATVAASIKMVWFSHSAAVYHLVKLPMNHIEHVSSCPPPSISVSSLSLLRSSLSSVGVMRI